jgi:hypothetical protein
MVSSALSARITALREALPPDTAASVICAGDLRRDRGALPLATGIEELDRLLSGGLGRGNLVEITGRRSSGRLAVALSSVASATGRGENSALVDLGDALDPENAAAAGADLRRLFWVRPRRVRDAVYAAEVVIGAGFPLVVLDLGIPPLRGRAPDAAWVRLARAARAQEAALLVMSPYPVSGTAAQVVLRLERGPAGWSGGPSPRLLAGMASRCVVEKKRGERPGRAAGVRLAFSEAIGQGAGESAAGVSAAAKAMADEMADKMADESAAAS